MSTSGSRRKSRAAAVNPEPKPASVYLKSHRDMITSQAEVFKTVRDNPELSRLLILNPVVAFEDMGVKASPSMQHHILTTIQHPAQTSQRRAELEKTLKDKAGQPPKPNDPEWVSKFLFDDLNVKPLDTKGLKPTYLPLATEAALKRMNNLRPPATKRYNYQPRLRAGSAIELKSRPLSLGQLDLSAPLPKLKTLRKVPKEVTFEELYFYKDSNPLAHDLLELGIIQRTGFNFHSRASIRKIKEGKTSNALYNWVKSVSFPEETPK